MGQTETLLNIDMSTNLWEKIGGVIVGVLVGIAVVALIVGTAGAAALILGATISLTLGSVAVVTLVGVSAGLVVGVYYDNTFLPDDLSLPMYSISAEEIFKGNINLFDIDFFNPHDEVYIKVKSGKYLTTEGRKYYEKNKENTGVEMGSKEVSIAGAVEAFGNNGALAIPDMINTVIDTYEASGKGELYKYITEGKYKVSDYPDEEIDEMERARTDRTLLLY